MNLGALTMYEKLLAKIYDLIPERRAESQYYTARVLHEAADAIEELQRQIDGWIEQERNVLLKSEPKWIPATDRLPETPGEYMVAYHPCYWDRVHDEIKVGLDSFRGKTSWAKKKYQRVTHWMPLPEPPEEKADA